MGDDPMTEGMTEEEKAEKFPGGVWSKFINRDPFPVWVWRDPEMDDDILSFCSHEIVGALMLEPRQILEVETPVPVIRKSEKKIGSEGLSGDYAHFLRNLKGFLLPEEAAMLNGAKEYAKTPIGFRSGNMREYRERYCVVWENLVLAVCMSEKMAKDVQDVLCPTYGKVVKEIIRFEFAKVKEA